MEKNLKQSSLLALWKNIQNTQEVKENTFQLDKTGQNVWVFEEVLFFFKLHTTKKHKNKQSVHLAYVSSMLECWQKQKAFPSTSIPASNWYKLSELIVCFSFFYPVVRSLEKEDFLQNLHILSHFVQLKCVLFNLLCVLDALGWPESLCLNAWYRYKIMYHV